MVEASTILTANPFSMMWDAFVKAAGDATVQFVLVTAVLALGIGLFVNYYRAIVVHKGDKEWLDLKIMNKHYASLITGLPALFTGAYMTLLFAMGMTFVMNSTSFAIVTIKDIGWGSTIFGSIYAFITTNLNTKATFFSFIKTIWSLENILISSTAFVGVVLASIALVNLKIIPLIIIVVATFLVLKGFRIMFSLIDRLQSKLNKIYRKFL